MIDATSERLAASAGCCDRNFLRSSSATYGRVRQGSELTYPLHFGPASLRAPEVVAGGQQRACPAAIAGAVSTFIISDRSEACPPPLAVSEVHAVPAHSRTSLQRRKGGASACDGFSSRDAGVRLRAHRPASRDGGYSGKPCSGTILRTLSA